MHPQEILYWLVRLGFIGFVAALIWYFALHRRADFTIAVRAGQVEFHGKIAQALQRPLADFLLKDLMLVGPARIMGARTRRGLQLWFRGNLTAGQKQRIRNFLLNR